MPLRMSKPSGYKPKNYSWSQAKKYLNCGMQYQYSKVFGLPEKAGVGLLMGIASDEIVMGETGFFADLIGGAPKSSSEYEADFSVFVQNTKDRHCKDWSDEEEYTFEKDYERVRPLIAKYCDPDCEPHRHLKPLKVQVKYNFNLHGLNSPIIGYSDLIAVDKGTHQRVVVDLKCVKTKPWQSAAYRLQTSLYALAEQQDHDLEYLPKVEIHSLVKTKKPAIDALSLQIETSDITTVYQMLLNLQFGIESNYFPLNRLSNLCSMKYCSFYEKCFNEHDRKIETLKDLYAKEKEG